MAITRHCHREDDGGCGVHPRAWRLGATAANLLTNDALDPQALIPEFKACAVQVFPAREDELANPEVEVRRGGIRVCHRDTENAEFKN